MSDPRLVFRDDATGEGILVGDDGVETSVHLPSLEGLRYVDETRGPSQGSAAPREVGGPVDDGIMSPTARPTVTFAPRAPDQQVLGSTPRAMPALYAAHPSTTTPDLLEPDPADPEAAAAFTAAVQEQARAHREYEGQRAMRRSLETSTLPTDPGAPARVDVPSDVPASWLAAPSGVPLPPSAAELARRDALLRGAPVDPRAAAPAPIPPGMRGPTDEERARGAAAGPIVASASPSATRSRGTLSSGGPMGSPSPRTPLISPQVVRDFGAPEAFDQTIEEIAGPRRDLVDRQTDIAQRQAQIEGDSARRQQQVLAASEDERAAIEAERRGAMQQATDRYTRAIDRVANARVDPNQWFRDQGAFGTVGATIAVALGALGSAISGSSTNGALEQINQAIDRDIAAQQSEIESGQAAAGLEGNMLAVVGGEFEDREAARQAARAAMLGQAELELQAHTADLASDEALVNAEALRVQLATARATAEAESRDRESQIALRNAQARRSTAQAMRDERRAMGGGGAARPRPITRAQHQAYQAAIEEGYDPTTAARMSFPEGSEPFVNPPSHAPIAGPERVALEDLNTALDLVENAIPGDVHEDIPGYGATGLFPRLLLSSEGRGVRQTIANLRDAFGRDRTGANMPPSEIEAFNEILGSSATSSDEDLRRGLGIMRSIIAGHLQRSASQLGVGDRDLEQFGGSWVE